MIRSLLTERRFAPLFWCQFFAAFNDNFLKNALLFLILWGAGGAAVPGGEPPHTANALIALAGAVFILPFFLLSALGGELADRYDKALLAQRIKLVEIAVAVVAVLGFVLHSIPILFLALFAFGTLSALFGPVKYGILPDHLPREALPAANALVEGATFLAIIGGTAAGGVASTLSHGTLILAVSVLLFAVLSWLTARLIPPSGEAAPNLVIRRNILRSTWGLVRELRADRRLWWTALTNSWFWLLGAIALGLLPGLIKEALGGGRGTATLALLLFCLGIGAGSLLAAQLTGRRVSLLPAIIGTALTGVFLLDIWRVTHGAVNRHDLSLHVFVDLVLMAGAGGLLAVPSFAALQAWATPDHRARVVAGANVISAGAIALGALLSSALLGLGLGVPLLFGLLGLASLAAAAWMLATMPMRRLPDLLWVLFRIFYRIEVSGAENLGRRGPRSIIALNHISWLDAALVLAVLDTPPVFVIDQALTRLWWVRMARKLATAIALDPSRAMATRQLIRTVREGQSLAIFPEGRISVTGSLMKVYDGAALIAAQTEATILPMRISGLEMTPFSRAAAGQTRRRWFPKVRVTVLPPERLAVDPALRGRARRDAGSAAIYGLMSDLIWRTTPTDMTIFEAVARAAAKHGRGRIAAEDTTTGTITYRRLLTGAAVLGRVLAPLTAPREAVGVLMPNANASMALVLGLISSGRIPTLLNFTAGAANLLHACRAAEVRVIITSRAFILKGSLEKLIEGLEAGDAANRPRIVYLEDIRKDIGLAAKLRGMAQGGRPLRRGAGPDNPAAIVFTSGSEGTPKGVVISHRAMLANIAQVAARIDYGRSDHIFNVLPLFHSFGLTCGLVLPLVYGVPVFMYPSPLHYKTIPELIYRTNATVVIGTDTFLAGYARTANPYDFRSLRYVVAGGEPVKAATRALYLEKFGIRLLEGYGVTETGPVLALNTPMFNRSGTVGRLLPGILARLDPVPGIMEGGRLVVRGPNVMLGYLRAENPGVIEPPPGGWHDTGDIVTMDADGFITIRGRAKRFAKLGGEMISLAAVDALAADLWPDAVSVAAGVPDARKGERIILLTEQTDADRSRFLDFARSQGATELMVPAEIRVISAVPLLGSGKVDFAAVQRMALGQKADQAA